MNWSVVLPGHLTEFIHELEGRFTPRRNKFVFQIAYP